MNGCEPTDFDVQNWIYQNIDITKKDSYTIAMVMPNCFECYAKILHPFFVDLDAPKMLYNEELEKKKLVAASIIATYNKLDLDEPALLELDLDAFARSATEKILEKHQQDRSILNLAPVDMPEGPFKDDLEVLTNLLFTEMMHPLVEMEGSASGRLSYYHPIENRNIRLVKNKKKLKWKELAAEYDLPFHPNISTQGFLNKFKTIGMPVNIFFPEFSLDMQDGYSLMSVLKKFTDTTRVYVNAYSESYDYINELCPIEKMLTHNENNALKGGYILDESTKWMIFSDYFRDLEMTFFGGTKDLLEALQKETQLEVLECPLSATWDQ